MALKSYLVFTTINIPSIAINYCNNFERFSHKKEIGIIIIGDKKTPDLEAFKICEELKKGGFEIEYFGIEKQEKWLEKFPKLKDMIPYNSDNRRNIGYLIALKKGCKIVISVDDDNFPIKKEDFLAGRPGIQAEPRL